MTERKLISFIEYLEEMVWYQKPWPPSSDWERLSPEKHKNEDGAEKKVSTLKGHDIYRLKDKELVGYSVVHSKSKQLKMQVSGVRTGNRLEVTRTQRYGRGGKIKAHHLYQHLINAGHEKEIMSDGAHTPGGRHIWQKLKRLSGVEVHGYDTLHKKVLPHRNVYTNQADHDDRYSKRGMDRDEKRSYKGDFLRLLLRKKPK